MLLKTMGIALIIGGFGGFGLSGARCFEKRVDELKNIRMALGFLEKEITCAYTPLSLALTRTAVFCKPPVSLLFAESAKRLKSRQGTTAAEAWRTGLQKMVSHSHLNAGDINLLDSLAVQLGRSDADEQRKVFDLLQEELRIQEEKAREELNAGHKLWTYGGFIIGAAIVLLLI